VQPVFDRHCTGCHGGLKPAADLDFSGGLTARHNRAYDTILEHKLIARSNVGDDARITMPLEFGSHKSKLVAVLRSGACSKRAKLSEEDWYRLVTWIDANGPYHDDFLIKRLPREPYDMPNDAELAGKISAVHARRCGGCHAPADVSRLDWIDLARPTQSRFLAAPAANGGGKRVCTGKVYRDAGDPDYAAVKQLVESAVRKAWELPRRDVKALRPPRQVSAR
jgi:mono/diheme cytochrome c family protein